MSKREELIRALDILVDRVPLGYSSWDYVQTVRFKTALKNAVKEKDRNRINEVRIQSAFDDLKRFY